MTMANLTDSERALISRARDIGPALRASTSDRDRLAGWLLDTLAVQLERDAGQLAEIRAVLDAFDWERDDRQDALEQIEMIVGGEEPSAADN